MKKLSQKEKEVLNKQFSQYAGVEWWHRLIKNHLKFKSMPNKREHELQPERIRYALMKLEELGYHDFEVDDNLIRFIHKEKCIRFYPYSGWFQGKSIKPGRGLDNLIKQLKTNL